MDIKAFVVTKEEMQTKESLNKLARAHSKPRECWKKHYTPASALTVLVPYPRT